MLVIGEVLVSDEIIDRFFHCNLPACKGACCYEGDWGAPLEEKEIQVLTDLLHKIKPYLSPASWEKIEVKGFARFYSELGAMGTSLHDDGSCVFLIMEKSGISKCGIEHAYQKGAISFRKPISCHLYPIRRNRNNEMKFDAINYDQWEICHPACQLGEEMKIPVYQFAKAALIRAYGKDFYKDLDAAAQHFRTKNKKSK